MSPKSTELLPAQKARQLTELAEKARENLLRLNGYDVNYDATGAQLLDEWIEHYSQGALDPPVNVRLLWMAFLGEILRRRFGCEWALQEADGNQKTVALICPVGSSGHQVIDITEQIDKRVSDGISASVACFYLATAIDLRSRNLE